MTLSKETVINKALSGAELREVILQDAEKLVAANGLLSNHIAYGQIGYELRLTLHLNNFQKTIDETKIFSRPIPLDRQASQPGLAAIAAFPLPAADSADAVLDATRLTRAITSPNAERVRAGMGIPVVRRGQDGSRQEEIIHYPPDPSLGEGNLGIESVTEQTARELGIALPAPDPEAAAAAEQDSAT
jgi:hypothetical protein